MSRAGDKTICTLMALLWLGVAGLAGLLYVACAPLPPAPRQEQKHCQDRGGVLLQDTGRRVHCIPREALAAEARP